MKKILFAIAIIMTMGFAANAQSDTFFKWTDGDNEIYRETDDNYIFTLPDAHGYETDEQAPLGSGLLVLTALGAGYAVARRRRNL
ncbi:MAG: hypothetical protein II817_00015 [Bacteroidales bacterium]|nr:hypothetical protein [Bacteroidales bacterium]